MTTLNSPVHPLPIAQTPGAFIRANLPALMHRYIQFWHIAICRQHLDEFEQWYDPILTYVGRGSAHGARWSILELLAGSWLLFDAFPLQYTIRCL